MNLGVSVSALCLEENLGKERKVKLSNLLQKPVRVGSIEVPFKYKKKEILDGPII